jgi:putative transposase
MLAWPPPFGGHGYLDQGRFKSFPVRDDGHLVTDWRYMERNALRAGMVTRAEDWPRCSQRRLAATAPSGGAAPELSAWPVERPPDWVDRVNRPMIAAEQEVMRRSLIRGQPFGAPQWQAKVAGRLGLQSAFRPRGRPRRTTGS